MKNTLLFPILFLSISLTFCQSKADLTNLDIIPVVTEADKKYKHAYQLLDGEWKGQFKIYEDQKRKKRKAIDLEDIGPKNLDKKGLKLVGSIDVTQVYTSETPYFQRVTITDYYPDQDKSVVAKGVNKVVDGQLFCVVIKPDDTVIHDGYLENENTIIWQRSEKNPQKVEYFRETVDADFYEIIGWGYYDGDDLALSPKFWFHGKYERQ